MDHIVKTENHPIKIRKFLGPLGRLILKAVNWDVVGNLPDKKRIILFLRYKNTSYRVFLVFLFDFFIVFDLVLFLVTLRFGV